MLLLLLGCSPEGVPSSDTAIIRPDWKGSHFSQVEWSPDGKQVSYIKDRELWVKNLSSGKSRELLSRITRFTWIDSKKILYFMSYDDKVFQGNLGVFDLEKKQNFIISKNVPRPDMLAVHDQITYLGKDERGVGTQRLAEPTSLNELEIPLSTGRKFMLSPRGDRILFLESSTKKSRGILMDNVMLYDIATRKVERIERLQFEVIYSYCWSSDGKFLAFAAQLPGDTQNLFIYKIGSDKEPAMFPLPDNASYMDWSPINNQIILATVGQPSGNEVRIINIPNELLQ
ncbi:DPP IV N-terminal domain-containing protein [Paenibacillus tyrfis]|uniref:DPP IV N-terminal domain-containing protein n=1 Tax=Paenibacillus tyrfis TaxID=1501230 RepID=UPI000B5949F3|nr:DPP IV N-terminal domain-containing protein [Paenibacillus tyrfis]